MPNRVPTEGKLAMWPPSSSSDLLAFATIALAFEDGLQRVDPFLGFQGVGIVGGTKFRQRGHGVSFFARSMGGVWNLRRIVCSLPCRPYRINCTLSHYERVFPIIRKRASRNQRDRVSLADSRPGNCG